MQVQKMTNELFSKREENHLMLSTCFFFPSLTFSYFLLPLDLFPSLTFSYFLLPLDFFPSLPLSSLLLTKTHIISAQLYNPELAQLLERTLQLAKVVLESSLKKHQSLQKE